MALRSDTWKENKSIAISNLNIDVIMSKRVAIQCMLKHRCGRVERVAHMRVCQSCVIVCIMEQQHMPTAL